MDFKEQHKNRFLNIRWHYLICLLLVIAILAVYGQVRDFEFINFDDPIYVTENRYVQQGLTRETFVWAFSGATRETNYWVPLTWLSILLDYELYGMNPGAFHLSNVFFHILNTLLLFFVFCRMTGLLWRSAFVAALFALHPLHVESVAWVTERKDVLSTFFWMLTLLAYSGYVKRPDYRRYFLVFLCFVLGMMAKPMLVTLPFVLLLLDYWPFGRYCPGGTVTIGGGNHFQKSFTYLLLEKVPFVILILGISIMTFLTQAEGGAVKSLLEYPVDVRIANALVTYVSYIIKMFWPARLAYFYPHPGHLPLWQVSSAIILLTIITTLAVKTMKRHPYVIVGWLWYLGTLFPVIGLVVIGHYVMADRYTYVPLIGLFVIIVWGIPELVRQWHYKKLILSSLASGILIVLSVASWFQAGYWQNSTTLYQHAVQVTRDNLTAYINLGVALQDQGRNAEASKYYLKVLRIDPKNTLAYNNLGFIAKHEGRTTDAARYYQKALETDPQDPFIHNNIGNLLVASGRFHEAVGHYEEAIKLNPRYAVALYNAGDIYLGQNRLKEAINRYLSALRIDPDFAEAHNSLGSALATLGRTDEAIFHFREAIRLKSDYTDARNNLKNMILRRNNIAEKVQRLEN